MKKLRHIARQIFMPVAVFVLTVAILPLSSARADDVAISALQPIGADEYLGGEFRLDRYLSGFDQPLVSSGAFILSPKDGLVWQNKEPFPDTTIMTDRGIMRMLDDGSREVIASGAQFHQFIALISAVLAGNWDALSGHFALSEIPPENAASPSSWQVELTPLANIPIAGQIAKITASGDQFVEHVTIKKPSGDYDEITLRNQKNDPLPLPDDIAVLLSGQAQ